MLKLLNNDIGWGRDSPVDHPGGMVVIDSSLDWLFIDIAARGGFVTINP